MKDISEIKTKLNELLLNKPEVCLQANAGPPPPSSSREHPNDTPDPDPKDSPHDMSISSIEEFVPDLPLIIQAATLPGQSEQTLNSYVPTIHLL